MAAAVAVEDGVEKRERMRLQRQSRKDLVRGDLELGGSTQRAKTKNRLRLKKMRIFSLH